MMAEPWERDPERLLEVTFLHDPRQNERAAAAVAAAVAEINTGYPAKPRAHARLMARADRVAKAWPDGFDVIELAVNEFLTREAQRRGSVEIAGAVAEAEALTKQAAALQARLGAMRAALDAAQTTHDGAEVKDSLDVAFMHAIDGVRGMNIATDALKTAVRSMPNTRGRGGALSRLRLSPDVALLGKLEVTWRAARLTTRSGVEGDGLDVFLYHAIAAVNRDKVSKGKWLDRLRAKAKLGPSSETDPR